MKSNKHSKKSPKQGDPLLPYTRGMTLSNTPGAAAAGVPILAANTERHFSYKKLIKRIILAIIVVAIIIGGWLGFKFYQNAARITGDKNPLSLFSLLRPQPLDETNGRVNILLAGDSADDPGHSGADLTDSIMVVSVDPGAKSAVLLSIPRDTWVDIPGHGYSKINAAYEDGGMSLLAEVVQQDFGIQTNYNALIDYTAFKDAVYAVGGITININSPDPRGLYDPYTNLNLPNGSVYLNGQTALNLARARGDGPGAYGFPQADFDRTQHQREMLVAIKDKVTSGGTILNPLKVSQLADAVGKNVQTNLTLGQMVTLYNDTKGISDNNIQSISLNSVNGVNLLSSYYAPGGQDALIPSAGLDNYTQIQSAINQILGTP